MKKSFLHTVLFTSISATTALSSALLHADDSTEKNALEEVVVTASKIETPIREIGAAVSVINSEELELHGNRSLTDILRTEAGIASSNTGGLGKQTTLRIRGEEGFRTQVRIDGINISDASALQIGPVIEHVGTGNDIERIEILRGPQGFIYGADAGGVINIFTRTPTDETNGKLSVEHGRYDTSNINGFIATGDDIGDAFLSISNQKTNGFNTRSNDLSADKDGYENLTLHGKLGWNITENFRTQFVARNTNAENEFDNCGFAPISNNCDNDYDQTLYKLSADYEDDFMSHNISFFRSDVEREFFTDGAFSFGASGDTQEINYLGSISPSKSVSFVYGLEQKEETLDSNSGQDIDRKQNSVFIEAQGSTNNNLFASLGFRHDDNDDFGEHLSARASIAHIIEANGHVFKIRSSYGSGFRAPSPSEISFNNGPFAFGEASEIALKEEQSLGFDIGLDIFAKNGASLEITYFDQEIEDEIFFDLVNFSGYLQNDGESDSKGWELAYAYPLDQQVLFKGNYTYNTTRDSDGNERLRRPKQVGNVGIEFSFIEKRLSILSNFRFSRNSVDIGQVNIDNYTVFDVNANFSVNDQLDIFARAENLFEEDYQEVPGFNTSDQAIYVGASYTF